MRSPCFENTIGAVMESVIGKSLQNFEASLEGFVAGGVADAEMSVVGAEDFAWDNQQLVGDCLFYECGRGVVMSWRFGECVERTARCC